MKYEACEGTGKITVPSKYNENQAICPICTKHVKIKIGGKTPRHKDVGYCGKKGH